MCSTTVSGPSFPRIGHRNQYRQFRCYHPWWHPVCHSPWSHTQIWGYGSFVCTFTLYKNNIFTVQTAPRYTALTAYCNTVGYNPLLYEDQPGCLPENITVFSHPTVTHSVVPLPPCTSLSPEGETSPSKGGIQDSEGAKDGIWSPSSEGDASGYCPRCSGGHHSA